ncbi:hypothetical protein B0H19DRAFT_1236093 [Mycena capillaripes]|nr:hypothetical protein B0H19DRAFT_1236093 [Mycena capillaripes]
MRSTTAITGLALVSKGFAASVRPHLVPTPTIGSPLNSGSVLDKRAVIESCLYNDAESSCSNLAGNCVDSVTWDYAQNLWSLRSCVAAATCYGVGNLITSVECQTGFNVTNTQASLNTTIYSSIVGAASGQTSLNMTQQNYIDFYYGELAAVNSTSQPTSTIVVVAWWNAIIAWAAIRNANALPYASFNAWLLSSSFPSVTTSSAPSLASYTQVEWNPNPVPPPGAVSETFVGSGTTVIIAIPTTTTSIVVARATITLAPGGTPINAPVPTSISQPGALTPTWNPNMIPPTSVASITFSAPPSYTTVVAVPTASNSPPQNITGSPGDKNSDGENWWLLLFGGVIGGLLPADIAIAAGVRPTAAPPAGWTGSCQSASSSSSSSTTSCPRPTSVYALSDDSENSDWEDEGTDPDRRRAADFTPQPRAGRSIAVNRCGLTVVNPTSVSLGAGQYYSIGLKSLGGVNTALSVTQVGSRPVGNGAGTVAQEHVFELGYIDQFFSAALDSGLACSWIQNNVWNFARQDGSNLGVALLNAIDQVANMVWVRLILFPLYIQLNPYHWVDKPMNQGESSSLVMWSILHGTSLRSGPESVIVLPGAMVLMAPFTDFGGTAAIFQATALSVQDLLAEITPDTPDANLPLEFNTWLRSLIATYPGGCTSRATNVYNYYVNRMNSVSVSTGVAPVPQCFPLYHSAFNPQTFNFASLVPPPPTTGGCDVPGTEGLISLGLDAAGTPIFLSGLAKILGSGNTNYHGLGPAVGSAFHLSAVDLSGGLAACQGVYEFGTGNAAPVTIAPTIALRCNGQSGNRVVAPLDFVINGQTLHCVTLAINDGSNRLVPYCTATASAANLNTCATLLKLVFPQAVLGAANYFFHP